MGFQGLSIKSLVKIGYCGHHAQGDDLPLAEPTAWLCFPELFPGEKIDISWSFDAIHLEITRSGLSPNDRRGIWKAFSESIDAEILDSYIGSFERGIPIKRLLLLDEYIDPGVDASN